MKKDRNCGGNMMMGQMYQQPIMPVAPVMPMNYNNNYNNYNQSIDQRLDNIEKRLSIIEANLNQSINTGFNGANYQIL